LKLVRFVGRAWRAHDPTWSFAPISGAGAAITGGRFNRPGEPTLYLALSPMLAVREASQGLSDRLRPLTLCEYDIDCADIVDLADAAAREAAGVAMADLACAWLDDLLAKRTAPSWRLAERLRAEGAAGAMVPSFAPGADVTDRNLVLWRWSGDLPGKVEVFDPTGRLPSNQLSWLNRTADLPVR